MVSPPPPLNPGSPFEFFLSMQLWYISPISRGNSSLWMFQHLSQVT